MVYKSSKERLKDKLFDFESTSLLKSISCTSDLFDHGYVLIEMTTTTLQAAGSYVVITKP